MEKITPFLWFNENAKEAVDFYLSVFKDGKILKTLHYGENAPLPAGTVLTINFIINGQEFVALNGGPHFTFSPAVSFVIHCDNQQQIDYYWDKLVAGGAPQQCGWLTDRFGVTWQIVPTPFLDMLSSGNKAGAQRATDAMMQMIKLDLPTLQRAFNNQ